MRPRKPSPPASTPTKGLRPTQLKPRNHLRRALHLNRLRSLSLFFFSLLLSLFSLFDPQVFFEDLISLMGIITCRKSRLLKKKKKKKRERERRERERRERREKREKREKRREKKLPLDGDGERRGEEQQQQQQRRRRWCSALETSTNTAGGTKRRNETRMWFR